MTTYTPIANLLYNGLPVYTATPSPTPSPPGSSITNTSGGSLVTADGTWTFGHIAGSTGNQTLLNGSNANNGYGVLLEIYTDGKIYQKNSAGSWYAYSSGNNAWAPTSGPGPTPSPSPTPTPTPTPGGRTVLNGFYGGSDGTAVQDYTINNTYQDGGLGSPVSGLAGIKGQTCIVSLDLGAVHNNASVADYQNGAAGKYDADYQQTLSSCLPYANQIIAFRIDVEFNQHYGGGTGPAYAAAGPTTYKACWNRMASFVRKMFPNAKIIFNPNVQNGPDVTPYFPGPPSASGGADIWGFDAYMAPQWNTTFAFYLGCSPNGLAEFATAAKAAGVPIAAMEWADLYSDATNLSAMAAWLKSIGAVAAAYWNSNDDLTVTPPNSSPILTGAKAAAFDAAFPGKYTGTYWTLP